MAGWEGGRAGDLVVAVVTSATRESLALSPRESRAPRASHNATRTLPVVLAIPFQPDSR